MTVNWESDGSNGIRPEDDKNIVPKGASNKDVGETDDRWTNAYVVNLDASKSGTINSEGLAAVDRYFCVEGGGDAAYLIYATANVDRILLGTSVMSTTSSDARTIMCQDAEAARIPVASFKQRDEDEPFVDFEGTSDDDQSKSISTANGNGSVDGPKTKNTADYGWNYARMIRISITDGETITDYWIPAYSIDPGE